MATIKQRGESYLIRCFDIVAGKQRSKTWKPEPGMTDRQISKALNIAAVEFEKLVTTGWYIDGSITFSDFMKRWFSDYAESQLQPSTFTSYKTMAPQIDAAIGQMDLRAEKSDAHKKENPQNL